MSHLPHRRSLATQLGEILRKEMEDGRWGQWLPEERKLARMFQVSRFTLRRALSLLREQGLLETRHGIGTRITVRRTPARRRRTNASIGVLIPRALEEFRYFITLVVDDLKTLLFDRGLQLMIHVHPQVQARRPTHLLEKLVRQQKHSCWMLMACGPDTQQWFSRNGIPAVVSGTCDAALGLPFVCLDNHALGRHAALTLLQHGHRQSGAILSRSNPGLRSGLDSVVGANVSDGTRMTVCEVDDNAPAVARAVDRLLALPQRPSALFLAESSFYLAAFSRLAQLGLRVPQDMSLVCRDDEPYLASLLPTPVRYSKNPHLYAKLLAVHVGKLLDQEPVTQHGTFMMPEFLPGESLRRL